MLAKSGKELIELCAENNIKLSEYAIIREMDSKNTSREKLLSHMQKTLNVMRQAATEGREKEVHSISGLIGGDAFKLQKYLQAGNSLMGDTTIKAMAMALSSSEVNASMGKIVACPTAGSCGILPAAILTAGETLGKSDEEMVQALFSAAAIGMIIGMNATFAGAEGGCQAE
ncbi:MAG: L-serine ammonia-lyase, iron-sulfur-dependent, subunit beta, partial [Sarcina sp.]